MGHVNPSYPYKVWDGDTANTSRQGMVGDCAPNQQDWDRIRAEVIATQEKVNEVERLFARTARSLGLNWRGAWDAMTVYAANDAVERNGASYVATTANMNAEPPSPVWDVLAAKGSDGAQGLPGDKGDQGDAGAAGPAGITWRGTWSGATAYVLRDGVTFNGTSYVCTAGNTNQQPPNASYWDVLAAKGSDGAQGLPGDKGDQGDAGAAGPAGINWRGAWSSATAYDVRAGVTFNGTSYVCTVGNTNQQPPNASYWDVLAAKGSDGAQGLPGDKGDKGDVGAAGPVGITWRGAWSGATAYVVRDGVTFNGTSYVCTAGNTNQQPPNASYWDVLAAKGDTGAGLDPLQLTNGESVPVVAGQAVYVSANGVGRLAKANGLATASVVGLIKDASIPAGLSGGVVVNGVVVATAAQWDTVTGGSGGLTPGTAYYLSPATSGSITPTPPSADGQFVCRLGVAISATSLWLNIEQVIQL